MTGTCCLLGPETVPASEASSEIKTPMGAVSAVTDQTERIGVALAYYRISIRAVYMGSRTGTVVGSDLEVTEEAAGFLSGGLTVWRDGL